jgi:hypothetical protein
MEKTMQRKVITTTLGDLIVAVTDEIIPIIRDPSARYMMVSCILADLLARQHARVSKHLEPKYAGHWD